MATRLVLLVFAPHTDPSESRYAEISRKMVETGDWITPQDAYHVPFLAKPPLSMWMSALGMKLFGENQFGSRIFIFGGALAVMALVARAGRRELGAVPGLAAATMLLGMPLFYYCSAAVMTDLALVLGTTLAMVGFREAMRDRSKLWGYGFFVGLAVGLLAKGPLVLVMAGVPIGGWVLATGQWMRVWKSLPWFTGTVLMLALAVPWYILAEYRTPGFLDYFIVGEHWKRFTEKGWKGDRYGSGHASPIGVVWPYWLFATFPWCFGFLAVPFSRWREFRKWVMADEARVLYWGLWALWPLVFFTPARNIIITYPLPALPATALLLAAIVRSRTDDLFSWKRFQPLHPALIGMCGVVMVYLLAISLVWLDASPKQSERDLVRRYQLDRHDGDQLLYYGNRRYSAEFYTRGAVDFTGSPEVVMKRLAQPGRLYLVVQNRYLSKLPADLQKHFTPIKSCGGKKERETLYVERTDTPDRPTAGLSQTSTTGP